MELQVAWQRSQNFCRLIGIRPGIRNQYDDRIVENFDDVTLTIDDREMRLSDVKAAGIELQSEGV